MDVWIEWFLGILGMRTVVLCIHLAPTVRLFNVDQAARPPPTTAIGCIEWWRPPVDSRSTLFSKAETLFWWQFWWQVLG
ncbi:hypothetical protein C2857_007063 [Epichloe festucae Fl1]|uniref:Uncharacterized protein n=1 Tax=Epichloe festucae (strain Fl1) TaxID=877507 RepID=A0A7S9KTV3_EPIFF|nr:hypothetical protein C2857_007063 [Epichloe festucae Fl1]